MNEKSFDRMIDGFKSGKHKASDWNFCIDWNDNQKPVIYAGYIMGQGAEQCAGCKVFSTKEEVTELFKSVGATDIMDGVG